LLVLLSPKAIRPAIASRTAAIRLKLIFSIAISSQLEIDFAALNISAKTVRSVARPSAAGPQEAYSAATANEFLLSFLCCLKGLYLLASKRTGDEHSIEMDRK
jgi:hypothetical protein